MESSSQAEPQLRPRGASLPWIPRRERMRPAAAQRWARGARRRAARSSAGCASASRPACPSACRSACGCATSFAIGGAIIMASWAALEALFGDSAALPWEIGFTTGFLGVLALNARGAHRAARLLLDRHREPVRARGRDPVQRVVGRHACRSSPWRRSRCCCSVQANGCWRRWARRCPCCCSPLCKSGIAAHLLDDRSAGRRPAGTSPPTPRRPSRSRSWFRSSSFARTSGPRRRCSGWGRRSSNACSMPISSASCAGGCPAASRTPTTRSCPCSAPRAQDLAAGALDLKMIAPLEPFADRRLRHGPTSVYELSCRRKDGTTVPILVGVALLDESDDEVVGFVLDLTAQKTRRSPARDAARQPGGAAAARSVQLDRLPRAEDAADRAAAQPQLLSASEAGERSARTARPCARRSRAARRPRCAWESCIDALLDVAHIHRGRFTLNVHEMDVVEAVRKVVSGFEVGRNGRRHQDLGARRRSGDREARFAAIRSDRHQPALERRQIRRRQADRDPRAVTIARPTSRTSRSSTAAPASTRAWRRRSSSRSSARRPRSRSPAWASVSTWSS